MSNITKRKRKIEDKRKQSTILSSSSTSLKFLGDSISFKNYYLNLGHVSYILRDWIKSKKQLPIPCELIDSVFTIDYDGDLESLKQSMKKDVDFQKMFLDHIIDNLVDETRCNFVSEKLNHFYIRDRCFRELAGIFNTNNLDINTKVTAENMPETDSIIKLLRCTKEIAECITPKELDTIRKFILHQNEIQKNSTCDCCIQTYISKDIKVHKKKKFAKKFVAQYNSSKTLVKNPLYIANFGTFQHLV